MQYSSQAKKRPYDLTSHSLYIQVLIMGILSINLFACDDGDDSNETEMTAGAVTAGEMTAGEVMAGEVMAGEVMAGEVMAGEVIEEGLALNNLIPEVAAAMCQGFFSCCDTQDAEQFFLTFQNNPRYEQVVSQLPPNVPFTTESCSGILELALNTAPFGRWAEQVNAGRVNYNGLVAETCLEELQQATCGDSFLTALYDSTCFSFAAPNGGEEQRKMFSRIGAPGSECMALNDGQGGVVYGTCDPSQAFCCVRREDGTCKVPEQTETGECVAVSPVGEACTILPSVQICATGNECGYESGVCEPPVEYINVQEGEVCTESFTIFGICENSYCDVTGTGNCMPFKDDGESCLFQEECASGACVNQVCGPDTYCR